VSKGAGSLAEKNDAGGRFSRVVLTLGVLVTVAGDRPQHAPVVVEGALTSAPPFFHQGLPKVALPGAAAHKTIAANDANALRNGCNSRSVL